MSARARVLLLAAGVLLSARAARGDDPAPPAPPVASPPAAPAAPVPPASPTPPTSPAALAVPWARAVVRDVREAKGARVPELLSAATGVARYEGLRALLTEDVSGADPRDGLAAFAEAVRGGDPGLAAAATAWAAATPEAIAAARALAARLAGLGGTEERPSAPDAARWLESTADVVLDPASPSLAAPELVLLRARALRRVGKPSESEALAAALSGSAVARRLDALGMRALLERGEALRALKRRTEAIDAYLASAEAARRLSERAAERGSLVTAWVLLDFEGRTTRARDVLVRIQALHANDVSPERAAKFELALASAERELGNLDVARAILTRVRADARSRGADDLLHLVANEWIEVCLGACDVPGALAAAEAALADASDLSKGRPAWSVWLRAAQVYRTVGRRTRAAELLARLRAAMEAQPTPDAVYRGHLDLEESVLRARLGRLDDARSLAASALAAFRATKDRVMCVVAGLGLAEVELVAGQPKAARALVGELRALSASMSPQRRGDVAHMDARIALAEGDTSAAVRHAQEALDVERQVEGFRSWQFTVYRTLAAALLADGRPLEALLALETASALLLDVTRGLVASEAVRLRGQAADLSAGAVAVLRALASRSPSTVETVLERAFRVREIGGALLLASDVARTDVKAPTQAELDGLRARGQALDALARAQANLVIEATRPGAEPEAQRAARTAVDAAHERVLDALSHVRRPGEAPALDAGLVTIDGLRRALTPGTAFVEFGGDGEGLVAIVCRRDGARVVDLGPVEGLSAQLEAWLELVSTPDGPHEVLGRRLHDRLFAPLSPALEGVERLLVMGEGRLAQVPLDALLDEHGAPLLERYEIAAVPSATTFVELSRRAAARPIGRGLVAVADPTRPAGSSGALLPSLAGTRAEVAAVAASHEGGIRRILVGDGATLDAFEAALTPVDGMPWRAVHLACHGWVDPLRPRLGGVLLSGGTVWNVERLDARSLPADLVVLSACDTIGTSWEEGEGLVGLVRPLLRAGATRVIASAWRVPDGSTATLLADVHRRWAVEGSSPGAALRESKRALRRASPTTSHPYAWASFVLWGVPIER